MCQVTYEICIASNLKCVILCKSKDIYYCFSIIVLIMLWKLNECFLMSICNFDFILLLFTVGLVLYFGVLWVLYVLKLYSLNTFLVYISKTYCVLLVFSTHGTC